MTGKVATVEAIVENGQIRLPGGVRLPEKAKVYVVIPGLAVAPMVRLATPRLANPDQAPDFAMRVTEDTSDAGL